MQNQQENAEKNEANFTGLLTFLLETKILKILFFCVVHVSFINMTFINLFMLKFEKKKKKIKRALRMLPKFIWSFWCTLLKALSA